MVFVSFESAFVLWLRCLEGVGSLFEKATKLFHILSIE